jgi:hypothetical protein
VNDPRLGAKLGIWVAWIAGGATVLFVFVAQYDAWKEQNEARAKAEQELEAALANGPQVWLDFQALSSNSNTGFVVESRDGQDALLLSIDPIRTANYQLKSGVRPSLHHGSPQPLPIELIGRDGSGFMDVDLRILLQDSCVGFQCSLRTILRYSDLRGTRFKRKITIDMDQLNLAHGTPLEVVNLEIERDYDVAEVR